MVKRISIVLLVFCLVGVGAVMIGEIAQRQQQSSDIKQIESQSYVEAFLTEQEESDYSISISGREYLVNGDVKTYLFLGTDQSGNEDAIEEEYQGAMADVLMLIVVDESAKTYGILQLNRDTITKVKLMQPDGSTYASAEVQLCTAHWYGGNREMSCQNTVDAVSNMLGGIRIDGYFAVSMEAMKILNHSVGGVSVVLEDDMTMFDPEMVAGAALQLSDEQAELLLQSRYGMEDDRNTERMRRQRIFLQSFLKIFGERAATDKDFIIELYDRLRIYSTDDLNINEIIKLCERMQTYESLGIETVEGESVIGQQLGDGIDHWEFYMDENSLVNVMQKLNMIGKG